MKIEFTVCSANILFLCPAETKEVDPRGNPALHNFASTGLLSSAQRGRSAAAGDMNVALQARLRKVS